jgi:hypothetical protein
LRGPFKVQKSFFRCPNLTCKKITSSIEIISHHIALGRIINDGIIQNAQETKLPEKNILKWLLCNICNEECQSK